jgi:glyoxylase-like metal-dependent hydrolase (beta-lactamase superfamily II)
MNQLESELNYPLGELLPELGQVHTIAPGVLWLRMGLPFALNHINLWLLEDYIVDTQGRHDGWTIIDCGIDNMDTRAAWETIFAQHLQGRPVLRVIGTHCHPDHIGLAHWICQRWNCALWMTAGEYSFGRMLSAALPGLNGAATLPHFQQQGATDPALLAMLAERKDYYPTLVPAMPNSYIRLCDGQQIRIGTQTWQIITGMGHSPEHAALYCKEAQLLISGDMVLPRISTNVSVLPIEPEANPVQNYLDSLQKFSGLPAHTFVLPSHGKPFYGLPIRIAQLTKHHAERLAEVVIACATPQSAATIVPIMFARALDTHQLTFALGEALAHLHKLWYDGVLDRRYDADGVVRFQTHEAISLASL